MFAVKLVKWERFLAVLLKDFFDNAEWAEFRKMSEVFRTKLYCKMSDSFCQFSLVLRLSTKKSEIDKIQIWAFEPFIFGPILWGF